MIRRSFIGPQRKIISFEINGKIIHYFDDMWKEGIQIMPLDKEVIKRLANSRSRTIKQTAALIVLTNSNRETMKEYKKAKTEEDLLEIVRKDCKRQGLLEVK